MNESLLVQNYYRPDHFTRYPLVLRSARGSIITDSQGRDYLDFFAMMGIVNCGHNQSSINQWLFEQIKTLWTSSFFPTEIQLQAITKMNSLLPEDLNVAILYSTGAEAIEFALRLARETTGRKRILSFRDHYHGKTHGTIFLVHSYPDCYGPAPADYCTVIDSDGNDEPDYLERCLNQAMDTDVAGIIFEPVIGYSGPRRLHQEFLTTIRRFCDQNQVIMIADEILTGFCRCRGWFVSCHEDISPDILVFGKGLGNGFPISGVACTKKLTSQVKEALPGSTFSGNTLASAVACGVLDFLINQDLSRKTRQLESFFNDYFSNPRFQTSGIQLDGMGGLLSIGFNKIKDMNVPDIYLDILRAGVIVSHTQTHLRISPPLTISMRDFEQGLEVIGNCISRYDENK
ncbi:aminotransferase class III-fold pyridoxal phosphate-dependent enzyme [candidate division CSSED10-310 bacterium]|uniref:Aminotransferase class III-fold pyridoxal phosphate-dependent enzyme n=1 Tax=candidate division CSSED10-310 bacterium TaxID=2855610 RepID=A0ABV6YSV6_UNCC1